MDEKFFFVLPIKSQTIKQGHLPSGIKHKKEDAIEYASKQLSGDTLIERVFICEVIEVVERASPPITTRPPKSSDDGETSTADARDFEHG